MKYDSQNNIILKDKIKKKTKRRRRRRWFGEGWIEKKNTKHYSNE